MRRFVWIIGIVGVIWSIQAQDAWVIHVDNPLEGDYYGITSANGQIGLVSSREPMRVDKVVVGGLYDLYGSVKGNNYFPNINPLDIELEVNGVRVNSKRINHYHQQMNLRTGTFSGSYDYEDILRVRYSTRAQRHLPYCFMTDVVVVAQRGCTVRVINQHRTPESLREPHGYLTRVDNKANPFTAHYPHYELLTTTALSPTGRHSIAATTAFLFPDAEELGTPYPVMHRDHRGVGRHTMEFADTLQAGDSLHFCVVGTIIASNEVPDTRCEAERLTVYQLLEGYNRVQSRHIKAWNDLWQSDIVIEGDPQAQQDIHNMLYHLYAFFRRGNAFGCSPMGLSGLGYSGHVFWDSETWMFPVLLLMHPDLAREMLQYRYDRLHGAKQKAYLMGYQGALYPWTQSDISGQESTMPHTMYPSLEQHVTGDIAVACWQYYQATQDKQWLREVGYPILSATATFWADRVEDDGSILSLTGPDEWNSNSYGGKQINNDAFTIGVAKTNMEYALKAAKLLGEVANPRWASTMDKMHWTYLRDDIIASHDAYRGEVTKQASVTLLAYPLHCITEPHAIRHNMEYYIDKVPDKRTPAMAKSIYSVLYARLGDADKALYYWRDSYLPNLNPPFRVMAEFNGGTNPYFITGAAGTLQGLLYGFAGLELTDKGLKRVYPSLLPSNWSRMIIRRQGEKDIIIE